MRLILIAFALLVVFFLSSRVKLSHTGNLSTPSSVSHIWEFAVRICRGYLPWVFYMLKRMLCCVCEQILLYGSKTF